MKNKGRHYERAFEAFINYFKLPYVPVSQKKKAVFSGNNLKSFDFIVYPKEHFKNRVPKALVDIKGRKLNWKDYSNARLGENWVTYDDIESLHQWQEIFCAGAENDFLAGFVFVYWVYDIPEKPDSFLLDDLFLCDNEYYYFVMLDLASYARHMTVRSAKWQTVNLPRQVFRQLSYKFQDFVGACNI